MEQISVTRALVQLKRIDSRLDKKAGNIGNLIATNKKNEKNVLNGAYTKAEFNKMAKAEWQSIQDLMALRSEIKSAIVLSNATTTVEIAGVTYTVAEAIEKKNFATNFEESLARRFAGAYNSATYAIEKKNDSVEDDAKLLFGKSSEDKKSELNRLELMKSYIDMNSWEIVDPINMKDLKTSIDKDVKDFLAEVDETLTECNSTTMITISRKPSDIE